MNEYLYHDIGLPKNSHSYIEWSTHFEMIPLYSWYKTRFAQRRLMYGDSETWEKKRTAELDGEIPPFVFTFFHWYIIHSLIHSSVYSDFRSINSWSKEVADKCVLSCLNFTSNDDCHGKFHRFLIYYVKFISCLFVKEIIQDTSPFPSALK